MGPKRPKGLIVKGMRTIFLCVVEFTNDIIAMDIDEWGGVGGVFVYPSKFFTFMTLNIVVCIGR